ncbi:hypothetical protein BY996DRAFT_4604547 [Phakopsora pachyrhizi]|uniref:DUF7872 domain-containing protein n=1 Tax=Phakopsora pachyrhizi TaxID=170000 RepID=A0AAV0B1U8_PHAPC|nr:hypothetical protein BY996DRAFT_4604547 [Phakopsora pachyrhizi]CAH7676285.1 hypothetical protein PPACK8108_LOCUS11397 [Phakopsora pachyrhizi]
MVSLLLSPIHSVSVDLTGGNWRLILSHIPTGDQVEPKDGRPDRHAQGDSRCAVEPFTVETWKKLKIDDYLLNYPGGKTLTLTQYASDLKMSNFVCGIGARCNAGQLCYPLTGKDYYILYAVQQWNAQSNIFYMASSYAMALVQGAMSSLTATLNPAIDISGAIHTKDDFSVQGAFGQVTGSLVIVVLASCGVLSGPWGMFFDAIGFLISSGQDLASYFMKVPKQGQDGFTLWTTVTSLMSEYEDRFHQLLSDRAKQVINSGISTDKGIYGALKNGAFIAPYSVKPIPDVEEDVRTVALALSLNVLLLSMECKEPGPFGARAGPDVLSWCDRPGGTMWDIFIAKGDDGKKEIKNAKEIFEQYAISTKDIVEVSYDCQKKHGFNFNMLGSGKFPKKYTDSCVFSLPVCDTRLKDISAHYFSKGAKSAKVCRTIGKLPI